MPSAATHGRVIVDVWRNSTQRVAPLSLRHRVPLHAFSERWQHRDARLRPASNRFVLPKTVPARRQTQKRTACDIYRKGIPTLTRVPAGSCGCLRPIGGAGVVCHAIASARLSRWFAETRRKTTTTCFSPRQKGLALFDLLFFLLPSVPACYTRLYCGMRLAAAIVGLNEKKNNLLKTTSFVVRPSLYYNGIDAAFERPNEMLLLEMCSNVFSKPARFEHAITEKVNKT